MKLSQQLSKQLAPEFSSEKEMSNFVMEKQFSHQAYGSLRNKKRILAANKVKVNLG